MLLDPNWSQEISVYHNNSRPAKRTLVYQIYGHVSTQRISKVLHNTGNGLVWVGALCKAIVDSRKMKFCCTMPDVIEYISLLMLQMHRCVSLRYMLYAPCALRGLHILRPWCFVSYPIFFCRLAVTKSARNKPWEYCTHFKAINWKSPFYRQHFIMVLCNKSFHRTKCSQLPHECNSEI